MISKGESESGVYIQGGEDVTLEAIHKQGYGVPLHQVTGAFGLEALPSFMLSLIALRIKPLSFRSGMIRPTVDSETGLTPAALHAVARNGVMAVLPAGGWDRISIGKQPLG